MLHPNFHLPSNRLVRLHFSTPHHPYWLRSLTKRTSIPSKGNGDQSLTPSSSISIAYKPAAEHLRLHHSNEVYQGEAYPHADALSTKPQPQLITTLGCYKHGELHLIPVDSTLSMRPVVGISMTTAGDAARSALRRAPQQAGGGSAGRVYPLYMRRKRMGEQEEWLQLPASSDA